MGAVYPFELFGTDEKKVLNTVDNIKPIIKANNDFVSVNIIHFLLS